MGWHDTEYDPRVDGYASDYGYRPSASDFAEEDFEDWRKQNFPRGYGPPWDGENDPDDPDLESLEETDDPERFLHPGDFESSPSAEPWDTPIYHLRTPGADYPDETDPAEWEDREEERAHENLRGHFGSTPIGGILRQGEQWPDRVAANDVCPECGGSKGYCICPHGAKPGHGAQDIINRDIVNDHFQRVHDDAKWDERTANFPRDPEHEKWGNGLDPDNYEFLHNKTPELGTTVPDSIGGDLPGTVNIRSRDETGPTDAFVMPAEESGLGYDAIVRHAPDGKGFDVLKPL